MKLGQTGMGELNDWLKYWRTHFSKCLKIHKDSKPHRKAYTELSDYLNRIEESADRRELDATVLWAVKFMQRMHELEREMGLSVPDKKVHEVQGGRSSRQAQD